MEKSIFLGLVSGQATKLKNSYGEKEKVNRNYLSECRI